MQIQKAHEKNLVDVNLKKHGNYRQRQPKEIFSTLSPASPRIISRRMIPSEDPKRKSKHGKKSEMIDNKKKFFTLFCLNVNFWKINWQLSRINNNFFPAKIGK